jgi:Ser/Thr protein kinase RdoA (MazF antagonist)
MLHNVGAAIGRMDAALQVFTHPSLTRNLQWDLALVLGVRVFIPHVTQLDRRALAEMWLSEFETAVLPSAANLLLPKQVRSVSGRGLTTRSTSHGDHV